MRSKFADLSLNSKLKRVQTVTVGLALFFTLLVTSMANIWSEQSKMKTEIETIGKMIAFNAGIALMFADQKAATEILAALSHNPTITAACLYRTDGETLAHYQADEQTDILPKTLSEARSSAQSVRFFSMSQATLLEVEQNREIEGYLLLIADLNPMWAKIGKNFLLISLVMVIAFSITQAFGRRLAALISAPLINLASIAQQVSREKNYALRATGEGEDEIGRMVQSFNQMIGQIQDRDAKLEQQRDQLENEVRIRTADLRHALMEAQAASVAKSQFLANMSHEIRTPMNGVIGMVDVMLNSDLNEEQQKMANVIRESAFVQLSILNDILDFSKIEAGKLELSPAPFVLRDLVENTWNLLEKHASQNLVEFSYTIGANIPRILEGDMLRLRQILNNLVTNAIKFSSGLDRQGRISLDVHVAGEDGQRVWIDFVVTDNGIGIDELTQSRLFQSFQQADLSTTRRYGGTGLGLVITRRLAEIMGGSVSVSSCEDKGSVFTVHLPFKSVLSGAYAENVNLYLPPEHSTPLATVKLDRDEAIRLGRLVLVAEDNETNQQVIYHQLGLLGLYADIAKDGCEALAFWKQDAYALLLTDIHMPDMDGYQLTQAIREQEIRTGKLRMPIIALTAVALKGEDEHCREVGMDDYLSKPVALQELKLKIEQWFPGGLARKDLKCRDDHKVESDNCEDSGQKKANTANDFTTQVVWASEILEKMVGNDEAMHRQLLAKYLFSAEELIASIATALSEGDIAQVGNVAHALKSASRSVGAMRLGDLCQALEMAGKGGDSDACESMTAQLQENLSSVRQAVRQRFPELARFSQT